jgi:hypothetical protein
MRGFRRRLILAASLIWLFSVVIFLMPTCARAQLETPWDRVARLAGVLEFYREDIHFGYEAGQVQLRCDDLDSLFVRAVMSAHDRRFVLEAVDPVGSKVPVLVERADGTVEGLAADSAFASYRLRFSVAIGTVGVHSGVLADPVFVRVDIALAALDTAVAHARAFDPEARGGQLTAALRSEIYQLRNEAALANLLVCLGQEAHDQGALEVSLAVLPWILRVAEQYGVMVPTEFFTRVTDQLSGPILPGR